MFNKLFLHCIISLLFPTQYDPSMQPQSPENSLEGASSYYTKQRIAEAMASVDIKLVLVPVIFVFLRCWGTIRYFIFMSSACSQPCLDSETQTYWLQVNDNCLANNPGLVMLQVRS